MTINRRDFIKAQAIATAAATAVAAGLPVPASLRAQAAQATSAVRWDRGVCRFCGTGCGIQVGTRDDRVVAVDDERAAVGAGQQRGA